MDIVFELLLQLIIEVVAELGTRWAATRTGRRAGPVVAAVGYACLGALAGLASLEVFPDLLIHGRSAQLAGLALTPLLAGLAMARLGVWRRRRGQLLVRLDHFACGYVFALALALVRFALGD